MFDHWQNGNSTLNNSILSEMQGKVARCCRYYNIIITLWDIYVDSL